MTKIRTLISSITLLQEAVMWLQWGTCFLMHYIDYRCAENAVSLASASHSVCFSICVLQLWHPVECISFSLSLTASPLVAQRAVFMRGFTRCWFNHWTDDRLSQKLRRQIHSPTLSRLPPRFFSACFVYIRLSLSRFLFLTRTISMVWLFFFFLVSAWHIRVDCLQTESQTHSLPPFLLCLNTNRDFLTRHNTLCLQIMISKL